MELTRRSLISLFATGALASVAPISAFADEAAETEEESVITAPAGSEEAAAQLIDAIQGDYVELFPVLRQYPDIWHEQCAAIVGEDDADETAETLQASMEGTLRGEEAAEADETDPDSMAFDCSFPDGIATLHFDGATVTGIAQDGTEVFSHEYEYLCYSPIVDFYVFRTADEDAGEYRYFVSRSDNPADPKRTIRGRGRFRLSKNRRAVPHRRRRTGQARLTMGPPRTHCPCAAGVSVPQFGLAHESAAKCQNTPLSASFALYLHHLAIK